MSGLRTPVVGGVAGGVGVTTLAVALRAHDAGRAAAGTADILACRGTLDSLRRAATVLERPGAAPVGPPPVLAVTLDGPRLPRGPLRARLELLDAAASAVVLLPHVPRWRTVADPLPEVAQLLVEPPERLPRPLRAYAAALRDLAAAVAASGRLRGAPEPRRPATGPAVGRGDARPAGRDPVPAGPLRRAGSSAVARPASGGDRPSGGAAPGAPPRVVGAFRPVVGSVVRPAPGAAPAASPAVTVAVRRPRGVRIVPATPRPRGSAERIEQVG